MVVNNNNIGLVQRQREMKTWRQNVIIFKIIHLLHAGEGNMKIYSPKSIIFSEGIPSASDVFLSKNDNSGRKTREASEGLENYFYFTNNRTVVFSGYSGVFHQ
jgi:hypothetical protein